MHQRMASRKPRSYPRTNSLAFSKVDCHTCVRLNQICDRQRPQCLTCSRAERPCGGYVMDLKWKDDDFSHYDGRQEYSNPIPGTATDELQTPKATDRTFKFVAATSKRRRGKSQQNSGFHRYTTTFNASAGLNRIERDRHGTTSVNVSTPPTGLSHRSLEYTMCTSASEADDEASPDGRNGFHDGQTTTRSWVPWSSTTLGGGVSDANSSSADSSSPIFDDEVEDLFSTNQIDTCGEMPLESRAASPYPNELPLSRVLFNNDYHRWEAVLDMYNQDFCVLPLTQDCLSNPFRVQKESCESSAFLLHAVLALASQHIAKKDGSTSLLVRTLDHQATALTLFREALTHTSPFILLETLLLLVNFEATQSASSTWSIHLNAALKILNSIGISTACQRSSRTRAQIAMLIWWDTTLAFISRKDLVFPLHYLETLMRHKTEDGWTYYDLNGCPADLVVFMARLSKLAAIHVKAEPLGCFNEVPVRLLADEVQSWKNPEDVTASDIGLEDIDPNARRNRFHCIEAWRHAVLLYTHRVFTKKQSLQGIRSITHLARVILDHVRCIPDTETVQKQTLLPVFLAAAEIGDGETRSWIRSYCDRWTVTARYDMFGTTAALLELIWADWLPHTRDVYWWGSKIGHNSIEAGNEYLISEILLG